MEIKSIGTVSTLEAIQNGKGFLFQTPKGKYWGVKTSDNQHSAVVMALEPSGPYDDVPRLASLSRALSLLSIPKLTLVPSSCIKDISFGQQMGPEAGFLYSYETDQSLLAIGASDGSGQIMFLDPQSGNIKKWTDFQTQQYAVISRWSFVIECQGKQLVDRI